MGLRSPRPPATAWGRAFEVAFESALAIVLGVVLGVYLDRRFDTEPVFLFIFAALGFAVCVRRLLSLQPPEPPKGPPGSGGGSGESPP